MVRTLSKHGLQLCGSNQNVTAAMLPVPVQDVHPVCVLAPARLRPARCSPERRTGPSRHAASSSWPCPWPPWSPRLQRGQQMAGCLVGQPGSRCVLNQACCARGDAQQRAARAVLPCQPPGLSATYPHTRGAQRRPPQRWGSHGWSSSLQQRKRGGSQHICDSGSSGVS